MKPLSMKEAEKIISWYRENQRDLPWRNTGDPYHVWISEIMLQQTRIEAVRPKYMRFIAGLPDIPSLAACDPDRLMRLWEGLGYYSRARNLQKCAKVLCSEYGGHLPADYDALRKLPGIGPYTAGAIASIAFGIPVPAVDGNVLRVIARYYGITDDIRDPKTKKTVEDLLAEIYDETQDAASFNQGIMELGQTVCLPNGLPECGQCPWKDACTAHRENTVSSIPFRSALKDRKIIDRTLFIIRDGSRFLLRKRPEKGLLAGLYEFCGTDGCMNEAETLREVSRMGLTPVRITHLPAAKHIFTHREWHMTAYEVLTEEIVSLPDDSYILCTKKELSSLAVPSAFRTYTDWYSLRDGS